MKPLLLLWVTVTAALWASGDGLPARGTHSEYPAHGQQDGISIGAEIMDPELVRSSFASDIYRDYLVVEVAVFPGKAPLDVSGIDFGLRIDGRRSIIRPGSPQTIAGVLQRRSQSRGDDLVVYPTVGVGVGTGSGGGPYGRRGGGGVITGTSVGVGVGQGGNAPGPASTDKDRKTMAVELEERGFPDGVTSKPVAGYLYFPLPSDRKAKSVVLEYSGESVKIEIPLKPPGT